MPSNPDRGPRPEEEREPEEAPPLQPLRSFTLQRRTSAVRKSDRPEAKGDRLELWEVVPNARVIDRWSVLITGACGRGEDILKHTEELVDETKAPDVKKQRRKVAPSNLRALLGVRRDFLVIRHTETRKLKPFTMFLGARDYGVSLQVYWYLTYQPTLVDELIQLLLWIPFVNLAIIPIALVSGRFGMKNKSGEAPPVELDLFQHSDLTAYVTNAHHSMLAAVDKVLLELGQNPSRIDRKSRGFLGIS